LLRGFYGFHTTDKGWADIAYNFLIDRFGQVWEGRTGSLSGPVKGDATGGSQGFDQLACFIGDHTSQPPTGAALEVMGKLLGALAGRYGIDVRPGTKVTFTSRGSNLHPAGRLVTTPTIAGHRDMSKTTCPGDACFPLIVSRLVPAAVAVVVVAAAGTVPTVVPGATPTSAPEATPTTAPGDTLPAANPGGAPLETVEATSSSVPPTLGGGAANRVHGGGRGVVAAVAGGGAVAAAGLVALVLRRRGNARESSHWQQARHLDEGPGHGGGPKAGL
ncbi:MAG: peptidoglycan recognition family protein, partial [Acidimicrobiales bacterium]